jgi:hypothetical protein
MRNAILEQPNSPRDVMVYVMTSGWMMGNYENGVWRLYFSDTGLQITKRQQDIVRWDELPPTPDDLNLNKQIR